MEELTTYEFIKLIKRFFDENQISPDSPKSALPEVIKKLVYEIEEQQKILKPENTEEQLKNEQVIQWLKNSGKYYFTLMESHSNIVNLIENTREDIWSVDSNLNILTLNSNFKKAYKTAFGIELIKGVNIIAGLPEPLKSTWEKRYKRALKGETFFEVDQFDTEGVCQFYETTFCPVYTDKQISGVSCFARDITDQKAYGLALEESESKYRNIFNSINDVFIRTNIDGTVAIISPSVFDVLGYRPDELIGKNISPLYKDISVRAKLINILLEKNSVKDFEITYKAKSRNDVIVSVNAKLTKDENGNPTGVEGIARDITVRKKVEQSLQERTRELNSIFDNAPVTLMLINAEGKILNINNHALQQKSKNNKLSDTIIGQIVQCVQNINHKNGCGKGDFCKQCVIRQSLRNTFSTMQDQNQVEGTMLVEFENKERIIHFLLSTTYINFENDKRVLLSLDDITGIKEAQEQIRKLSTAVNQSTATIVITDIKGNIQYANPHFEKTTGYKISEAIGRNPRILKSDKTTRDEYKILWETILNGKTWQGEFLNKRKDRTEYWENAIISPIFDEQGNITSFIAIKEDITERKKIQQELIKSEKELRQINDEKSRFFSILAHDLRGLVGSYHAYSDLLYTHFNEFSAEEIKEQLQNLAKSSKDSLSLLDDLLTWSKASLGKITLSPSELFINDEITTVINLLTDTAKSKQVSLENISKRNYKIITDPNVLQTILRNLVNNALKFTPSGGKIDVYTTKTDDNKLEISIRDTGIGMDNETLSKLFKPGENITREGTNNEKGTGLGLMICFEMVKKLKGEIAAESQPGKGSRFYFTIPL